MKMLFPIFGTLRFVFQTDRDREDRQRQRTVQMKMLFPIWGNLRLVCVRQTETERGESNSPDENVICSFCPCGFCQGLPCLLDFYDPCITVVKSRRPSARAGLLLETGCRYHTASMSLSSVFVLPAVKNKTRTLRGTLVAALHCERAGWFKRVYLHS